MQLKHFDSKTHLETGTVETKENTLAEYLWPQTEWRLGIVGSATTAQDLQLPDRRLEFSHGDKFYFASGQQQLREEVFPKPSDKSAYGSLLFSDNQTLSEQTAKILVVDDESGDNGGHLANEEARRLVGDCYGQISPSLHQAVGGEQDTPFQYRFASQAQQGDPYTRVAKGTLAPRELSELGDGEWDLVMPTSSFKGRKGAENGEIEPGEYELTFALGIKEHAYKSEHSLGAQVLVNHPKGVEQDIQPRLQQRLEQLEAVAGDPRRVAEDFVATENQRLAARGMDAQQAEGDGERDEIDAALGEGALDRDRGALHRIIETDLAHHQQLLEHPKVVDRLNEHLQSQYQEAATGRAVKFQGALLQPSESLGRDEFCDPSLPEGKEVIVTRSPLVNSNGVVVLTNRHLEEVQHQQGAVWMNPETAAERLQGDFDGDRVAYELGENFPNLAAEVKEKNEQTPYPEIVKKDKVPYNAELSFEEIALKAQDNQVGTIANEIMRQVALEQEASHLPEQEKAPYLEAVAKHVQQLDTERLPATLQGPVSELRQQLGQLDPRRASTEERDAALARVSQIHHAAVGELGNELQVAVDGPKSALHPD